MPRLASGVAPAQRLMLGVLEGAPASTRRTTAVLRRCKQYEAELPATTRALQRCAALPRRAPTQRGVAERAVLLGVTKLGYAAGRGQVSAGAWRQGGVLFPKKSTI